MKRKTVIIIALVVAMILLCTAACILPWSTSFEVKMSGYLYTDSNTAGTPVEITAQGTTLNYLFFRDQTKMQLITSGMDAWEFSEYTTPDSPIEDALDVPYIVDGNVVYLPDQEDMCSALYAFSIEEEMMLIYIKDKGNPVIACSADGLSKKEIMDFFSVFRQKYGYTWRYAVTGQ